MQNFMPREFCNTMRDFRSGTIGWVGLHMNIPGSNFQHINEKLFMADILK